MKKQLLKFSILFITFFSVGFCADLTLTWKDNSDNETGFIIERVLGANGTNFVKVGEVGANVTTYVDKNLPNNTTYSYRVRSFNEGGQSAPSNVASAVTVVAPPAPPSNLTANKAVWTNSQPPGSP